MQGTPVLHTLSPPPPPLHRYPDCLPQEVLRHYPPVGIGQIREATTDVTLAGRLRLPKGSLVWVPHVGMQNARHNWDDPEKFLPGAASPASPPFPHRETSSMSKPFT